LMPDAMGRRAKFVSDWPTPDDCARQLGWTDFQRLQAIDQVLARVSDPPFTTQLNHRQESERLSRLSSALRPKAAADAKQAALFCQAALNVTPDDPVLYEELAIDLAFIGDWKSA